MRSHNSCRQGLLGHLENYLVSREIWPRGGSQDAGRGRRGEHVFEQVSGGQLTGRASVADR